MKTGERDTIAALLRTSAPDVAHLILDVISLDDHETLMAASGAQAEAALRSAKADNAGKYVLVVEGAIPTRDDGVYMQLGGKPAIQVGKEVAARAAVIAIGSCASWGRSALDRSESNEGGGRRFRHFRKADRQPAGLPAQSL